jgi:hypothetical protein
MIVPSSHRPTSDEYVQDCFLHALHNGFIECVHLAPGQEFEHTQHIGRRLAVEGAVQCPGVSCRERKEQVTREVAASSSFDRNASASSSAAHFTGTSDLSALRDRARLHAELTRNLDSPPPWVMPAGAVSQLLVILG